jgi:hypothetical protein
LRFTLVGIPYKRQAFVLKLYDHQRFAVRLECELSLFLLGDKLITKRTAPQEIEINLVLIAEDTR